MRVFMYFVVLLCGIAFSACGSIDFAYDPQKDYGFVADSEDEGIFENPPSDKARIYAFREDIGALVEYTITLHTQAQADDDFEDGIFFGKSRSGRAFMIDVIPNGGKIYISAKTEERISLAFTPQASRIYCVASGIGMTGQAWIAGDPILTLVEKSACKEFIAKYLNEDSVRQWQEDKEAYEKRQSKKDN